MIIDVEFEDGTTQIAKVVSEMEDHYTVHFLEQTLDKIYRFSTEDEEIMKESVSGFYDVENLEETDLYAKCQDGYVLLDDSEDEDYEYSDEDETEDDISLIDEEEA